MSEKPEVRNRKEYFAIYRRKKLDQLRLYNNCYYNLNKDKIRKRQNEYYLRQRLKNITIGCS